MTTRKSVAKVPTKPPALAAKKKSPARQAKKKPAAIEGVENPIIEAKRIMRADGIYNATDVIAYLENYVSANPDIDSVVPRDVERDSLITYSRWISESQQDDILTDSMSDRWDVGYEVTMPASPSNGETPVSSEALTGTLVGYDEAFAQARARGDFQDTQKIGGWTPDERSQN